MPLMIVGGGSRLGIEHFWEDSPKPQTDLPIPHLSSDFVLSDNLANKKSAFENKKEADLQAANARPSEHWSVETKLNSGDKEKRDYDIFIPKGYDGKNPLPAMVMLHGVTGGDGQGNLERESAMNALADEKQFVVIYPFAKISAVPYTFGGGKIQDWNSPGAGLTRTDNSYDDVAYIDAVLKDAQAKLNIDKERVSLAGFSSGGAFATHLWGRMPGTFAAVASVHGTSLGTETSPQLGDKAAFFSFLSKHDYMLPADGIGRGPMTMFMPRIATSNPYRQFEIARRTNLATGTPTVRTADGVTVTEFSADQCGGFPVRQIVIDGGYKSGLLGTAIGYGKDGFPAKHAWDGAGKGGWPGIGEKNYRLSISRILADELPKYKKH
ncbi:MAG: hypothetical protein K2W82_07340 [Candidatus Obscuribacterales bacterium]|nr:hypothetical protein [Candidatus Obscuribacterales bacterium]